MLTSLRDAIAAREWQSYVTRTDIGSDWPADAVDTWLAQREALSTIVASWAARWHLDAPWVQEFAEDTALVWIGAPSRLHAARWKFLPIMLYGLRDDSEGRFSFRHHGWEPVLATRAQAEAAIREAFEIELREYLDRSEQKAEQKGLQRTPGLREGLEHCRWLARYQLGGKTMRVVAEGAGREWTSVRDAVHKIARLIGLTLRSRHSAP